MKQKSVEVFIPGPAGRLEGRYFKNEKQNSPIAVVLQPHPQYSGTMNNRIVVEIFNSFQKNGFSVLRPILEVLERAMERLIMDKVSYLMLRQP